MRAGRLVLIPAALATLLLSMDLVLFLYAPRSEFSRPRPSCEIAVGILVSEHDFRGVSRLLARLVHPHWTYCLFVDGKVNSSSLAVLQTSAKELFGAASRQLSFAPSHHVTYRGISHTLAQLDLMECSLKLSPQFSFWINLSGSDYPLLSVHAIHNLLCVHAARSRNYMSLSEAVPTADIFQRWRGLFIDPAVSGITNVHDMYRLAEDHPFFPPALPILKGSDWFVFSQPFVNHALSSSEARWLLAYFATTLSTSESYFSTLFAVANSTELTFVNDNLRFTIWDALNSSGQHPQFLGLEHWNSLRGSGALFARKFRPDSLLLDLIDEKLHATGSAECVHHASQAQKRIKQSPLSPSVLLRLKFLHAR